MKREFLIFIYVMIMGSFIVFTVAFLSRLSIYLFYDIAPPLKSLLYTSGKIGITGGVIGGFGTGLMRALNLHRRK